MNKLSISILVLFCSYNLANCQNFKYGLFLNAGKEFFNIDISEEESFDQQNTQLVSLGFTFEQRINNLIFVNTGIGVNLTGRKYSYVGTKLYLKGTNSNFLVAQSQTEKTFLQNLNYRKTFLTLPFAIGISLNKYKIKFGSQFNILLNINSLDSNYTEISAPFLNQLPYDISYEYQPTKVSNELIFECSYSISDNSEFLIKYAYNYKRLSFESINPKSRMTLGLNNFF